MAGITYTIDFAAQISRLEENTKKGSAAVKQMADEMESYANFAKGALAGLGAAVSVGAFTAAVKAAAEAADQAAKMGDRFGIATEKMIGMQHASQLAHVSNEALANAMRGVALQSTEAARGNEQAWKAFERLNINALEFVKLPMDRQLSIVIDRLQGVTNVALRNALAQQTMGKAAGEAINLVAEGSEAFHKATEDAKAWGLAIDRVDAAKIEMANDAITRAEAASKGLYTTISVTLAPAISYLANRWADASAEAQGHKTEVQRGMEIVVQAVGYAANVVQGLRFAYVAVKLAIAEVADFVAQSTLSVVEFFGKIGAWTQYIPGPLGVVGKAWAELAKTSTETLGNIAAATAATVEEIKQELDDLAGEGLPAEKIIAKYREIVAAVQKEAEKIARERQALMGNGEAITDDKPKNEGNWKQALRQKFDDLNVLTASQYDQEREALIKHRIASNKIIQDALDAGVVTEEQARAMSAKNFEYYERQKTLIQRREDGARFQSASTALGNVASLMQTHNKTLFEIGKKAAIAQTIVSTYWTAQKAFEEGTEEVNVYYGAALAAAAVIAGLARLSAIQGTTFEGGGASATYSASPGTTVPSGPAAAEPPPPSSTIGVAAQARTQLEITLVNNGQPLDPEFVRDMATALADQLGYGADVSVQLGT